MSHRPTISNDPVLLRSGAVTTSYVASTPLKMKGWNQCVLMMDMVLNTATDVRVKVEVANPLGDATPVTADWMPLGVLDIAAAVPATSVYAVPLRGIELTLTATDKYTYAFLCAYKWVRVSVKTTAGPGSTTLSVTAVQALV
jgi:hypothetical protein